MQNYSYNGEFVNLDNVQVAIPIDDNHIKLFLKGSAGADPPAPRSHGLLDWLPVSFVP